MQERVLEIGDRIVRALCTPEPRQVVLLPGGGSGREIWRPVLERLDGSVGACAYDRVGAGEEGPPERGWFELEDEMRRTHAALGFERGYTLVGHGIGGLYARLFASDRPTDVGGLVLVDPAHEDMPQEVRSGMPRAAWADWMQRRRRPNEDGVTEVDLADRAGASRLPDRPVTVITATERPDGHGWDARFSNQAARRLHASMLRGITLGRHVPAAGSGHDVHLEDPELVAREIVRTVGVSQGVHP